MCIQVLEEAYSQNKSTAPKSENIRWEGRRANLTKQWHVPNQCITSACWQTQVRACSVQVLTCCVDMCIYIYILLIHLYIYICVYRICGVCVFYIPAFPFIIYTHISPLYIYTYLHISRKRRFYLFFWFHGAVSKIWELHFWQALAVCPGSSRPAVCFWWCFVSCAGHIPQWHTWAPWWGDTWRTALWQS